MPVSRVVVIALVWSAIGSLVWLRLRNWLRARAADPVPARAAVHGNEMAPEPARPKLSYGFRGEGVDYRNGDRELEIDFTWGDGPRIFTDSVRAWKDGPELTFAERREVLRNTVAFVREGRQKPIVVINSDDPFVWEWTTICTELRGEIADVEMTSDAAYRAFQKKMLMDSLAAGSRVSVDGKPLATEADVDRYIEKTYPPRTKVDQ